MTAEKAHFDILSSRVARREAVVAIIGLGYIGLPLCCAAADAGFTVIGLDKDATKVATVAKGQSHLPHVLPPSLAAHVAQRRLTTTMDYGDLGQADAVIVCVPTPLTPQRDPDLEAVIGSMEQVGRHLRRGQLVVLESTTWPGTTLDIVKPILERGGLRSGVDFLLAFSPEREDPGNRDFTTRKIPKIVGGDGALALETAAALYGAFIGKVVTTSSTAAAEAVKLTENIFRAVNIALVNELKMIFDAMDLDVWEIIAAAETKPFGYMPFYPGPGLGGHCIPIDPFYLAWKAREFGVSARFIELAGEINTAMPRYVLQRLADALDRQSGKGLSAARILLLGVAYKRNISDMRESPALTLLDLLIKRGAEAHYHDPHVESLPAMHEFPALGHLRSVPLTAESVAGYDAVLVVTDHDAVNYDLLSGARLVVDTRNVCARRGLDVANLVKA